MKAELIYDCRHELAEGPVWHQEMLWWVSITAGELHRLDPRSGRHESRLLGGNLGCAIPSLDGKWVVGRDMELAEYDWQTHECHAFAKIPADVPQLRLNDGKCDAHGRLWVGSLQMELKPGSASLYCCGRERMVEKKLAGVTISNGICWSLDQRVMYYIDTLTRKVECFDYVLASGEITNRRVLVEFEEGQGYPDGMTMDEHGNLWIAMWGGCAVVCVDGRSGQMVDRIELPVSQPSSCCFGGQEMDTLWITTANQGLDESQRQREPHAGGIYAVKTQVKGAPVYHWHG